MATNRDYGEIVEILLNVGADPLIQNNYVFPIAVMKKFKR